jgi:8-oxo-dGTP diphosphatase
MIKVAAAVLEKEGKILVAKRRQKDSLPGKWEFPGGKIEPGETPEECLRRELEEEFAILAEIGEFICCSSFHYPHLSIELLAYKAKHRRGIFELKAHDEIRWVTKEELIEIDFSDADLPIVQRIMETARPTPLC